MSFSMVFPGQGAQAVGMLLELSTQESIICQTFEQASDVLGYDLWQKVSQGPQSVLNQTQVTQPALLTASVGLFRLWQQRSDLKPAVMAGHSLGEYSALVCAQALDFEQAVKLVESRGIIMQRAVPQGVGAMAAVIGLDNEPIQAVCKQVSTNTNCVAPANYNAPGQVVIAGHAHAVEQVQPLLKEAGAKRIMPLAVSVPSHCILMAAAAEQFGQLLNDVAFNKPNTPIIHNIDACVMEKPDDVLDALVRQLANPVQWTATVQKMAQLGISLQLEMGPGKVLTGLVKRIEKGIEGIAVNEQAAYETAFVKCSE